MNLTERLHRIVHLVLPLCAAAVVLAYFRERFVRYYDIAGDVGAGGAIIAFALATAVGALVVRARPTRPAARTWMFCTVLFGVGLLAFEQSAEGRISSSPRLENAIEFVVGTIAVLILVVMPLVTRARPDDDASGSLPTATGRSDSR